MKRSTTGNTKHEFGGKFKESADDGCIQANGLCVHVFKHNSAFTMCIMPLPELHRAGKTWEDLGF
jgi:hypothetical protein